MRLERLLEVNWCRHRRREIRLDPGLNAFLGRNGSGKSVALNGALFALVGDYSRNDGKKDANITQRIPEDEPSYVELELTHADFRCVIQRFLRGGQTTLTVTNLAGEQLEKPVRGDNKVTARVLELLGTTERILTDYVFVAQGAMFAPFSPDTRPADRAVAFQRLFGIDQAEAIWTAIGEYLATLPVLAMPDWDACRATYIQVANEVGRLEGELEPLRPLLTWRREQDPDAQLLSQHERAKAAEAQLPSWQTQRRTKLSEWWRLRGECRDTIKTSEVFRQAVAQGEPQQAAWVETIQQASRRSSLESLLQAAERALSGLAQNRQAIQDPIAPADGLTTEYLRQTLHNLDVEISTDSRYVNSFETGVGARCPTCGTAVASFRGVLEETRQRLAANHQTQELMTTRLQAAQVYESQVAMAADRRSWIHQQIIAQTSARDQHLAAIALLPTVQAETQARASLDHLQSWQAELRAAERVLNVLRQQKHLLLTDCRQASLSVRRLQQQIAAGGSAGEATAASQRLQDKSQRAMQAATLNGQFEAAKVTERAEHARLEAARAAVAAAQKQQQTRIQLTRIRDVLHRDQLPKLVIQRQLERLGAATNDVLASFGAALRLSPDEGLSYRADFFDGRQQPITRLSGGEQVLTALAFRIATNATFARELGMLCLDEPTVYLDAENLGCLDAALDWLRQASRSRGLQCILITHENIGHLFDHVEIFENPSDV